MATGEGSLGVQHGCTSRIFNNPWRAYAVRVTVLGLSFLSVCPSVCLSVTMFSAATRKTANK